MALNPTFKLTLPVEIFFTIIDLVSGKMLPKDKVREIFPADDHTGYYIDFVRLRPRISDEIPGERIHLRCEFDIGSAKEDGMFNFFRQEYCQRTLI